MIEIIPAIDLIDGKAVRLNQGDYAQKKVYNEDPLEVAKMFQDAGIRRLHLVDLDGAKAGKVINLPVLERIASNTNLIIDFGGGIKTEDNLKAVLEAGAKQVTLGSIAAKEPGLFREWLDRYSPEAIILGADVRDEKIAVSGWLETTSLGITDFLEEKQVEGAKYVLCTDISKDGMLQGTSMGLYKKMHARFPALNLIASGGITNISEIDELNAMGLYGVVIGKAIYENRITLDELKSFIK
ncbi:MAG: 1-(5-phosphoribosyl)-5-[(5-phosphoribosylamino)methylideneamino]imidazole-4-carboxamide isomerase [Bacteroidota bacterium]